MTLSTKNTVVMAHRKMVTLSVLLSAAVFSCGPVQFPDDRDQVFSIAVEASLNDDSLTALEAANKYLQGATRDDPRYDRALRLMALSGESLGLSYAASLWYLDIAQSRRDVELAAEAVRGLERISQTYPYDEQTILGGFLATAEITGLPSSQQAFIDYLQGMYSMRANLNEWADGRFAAIVDQAPYKSRARYAQAVRLIAAQSLDQAVAELEALLDFELPEDLKNEVYRTLARIAFEERDYRAALTYYDVIRQTAPDDPQLLLEMAWSHYYLGESRRALGLLVALDAPAYEELIAPERFLLEALALRRLCQFEPARSAAVRLSVRHGDAIADLRNGVPVKESEALRNAARFRVGSRSTAEFRQRLVFEMTLLDDLEDDIGSGLHENLRAMYELGLKEASRRENEVLGKETVALAQELLSAEEGVRLILHEIGVALLRARSRPDAVEEKDPIDVSLREGHVFYTFEGEFWTDELDDIVVTIEDRCID